MKKNLINFLILFLTIANKVLADDLDGRKIAEMVNNANQSEIGIVVKGKMILEDLEKAKKEERSYIMLSLKKGKIKNSLFRFTSSSYKGTTFLTLEDSGEGKVSYIFLSSIGSPRQIESSEKEKNFIDTDISNEEMAGSDIEDYKYLRLPDKKIEDMDCYVIERTPKRKDSKYKKHIVTVDKKTLIPIEVKMYDNYDRLAKVIKMSRINRVGSIYMPFETSVIDAEKKHKTIIFIESAYEREINPGYFNKNRMNRKLEFE